MAGAVVGAGGGHALVLGDDQRDAVRAQVVVVDGEEPAARVQVLQQRHVHHHEQAAAHRAHAQPRGAPAAVLRMRVRLLLLLLLLLMLLGFLLLARRLVVLGALRLVPHDLVGAALEVVAVDDEGGRGHDVAHQLGDDAGARRGGAAREGDGRVPRRPVQLAQGGVVLGQRAPQPVVDAPALHELHEVVLRHAGRHVATAVHREVGAPRQREVEPYEGGLLVAELGVPELEGRYGGGVRLAQLGHLEHGGGPLGRRLRLLLHQRVAAHAAPAGRLPAARVHRRAGRQRLLGRRLR